MLVALGGDVATDLGRFLETQDETQAVKDQQTRQAWAEIAHAVRDAASIPPVGGPPSERVKNPRSEGFWKTVHAKRLHFVETVHTPKATPGEARALRTLPIPSAGFRVRSHRLAPPDRFAVCPPP